MASGIFALLDDIAVLADDVAVTTKIATQKTAGILGDDLAVNAEKALGFSQERELKVIWAIIKGSLKNKAIILPIAFILSAFAAFVIPYILIFGGLYLLYEGAEKIEEYFHNKLHKHHEKEIIESTSDNILEIEKEKIKSAIITDFILSIEIVVISLGTVLNETLPLQIFVTTFVAIIATLGVYGIVALIIRLDNIGFWLIEKDKITMGNFLIELMPKVIKFLAVVGTFAMILVGGGILSHNIHPIQELFFKNIPLVLNHLIVGVIVGFFLLIIINLFKKIIKRAKFN
jgi:predicted DNA repair protein MutK